MAGRLQILHKESQKAGIDVLEISCMALRSVYLKDEQLLDLKKCAEDQGIIMTAGYGPTKEQNLCSGDPAVVKRGMDFLRDCCLVCSSWI